MGVRMFVTRLNGEGKVTGMELSNDFEIHNFLRYLISTEPSNAYLMDLKDLKSQKAKDMYNDYYAEAVYESIMSDSITPVRALPSALFKLMFDKYLESKGEKPYAYYPPVAEKLRESNFVLVQASHALNFSTDFPEWLREAVYEYEDVKELPHYYDDLYQIIEENRAWGYSRQVLKETRSSGIAFNFLKDRVSGMFGTAGMDFPTISVIYNGKKLTLELGTDMVECNTVQKLYYKYRKVFGEV